MPGIRRSTTRQAALSRSPDARKASAEANAATSKTGRPQQVPERSSQRCLIVDDEDDATDLTAHSVLRRLLPFRALSV